MNRNTIFAFTTNFVHSFMINYLLKSLAESLMNKNQNLYIEDKFRAKLMNFQVSLKVVQQTNRNIVPLWQISMKY